MTNEDRNELVNKAAAEYLERLAFDHKAHQPPASSGFRKGTWTVLFDGHPMMVYASVPRSADLETQRQTVLRTASRALAFAAVDNR